MRPNDAFEVGIRDFKSQKRDTIVRQNVVKNGVQNAVERDAHADREEPAPLLEIPAHDDKGDGLQGKKDRKNIVRFPPVLTRAVMAFVDKPQKSVHQVLVSSPSKAFHGDSSQDNDTNL